MLVGLVTVGCGSRHEAMARSAPNGSTRVAKQQFTGEQGRVASVIADYETAIRDGNVSRLCTEIVLLGGSYGNTASRRVSRCTTKSGDLAEEVRTLQHEQFDLIVKRVEIKGGRATAQVDVHEPGQYRVEPFYLERRAGRWQLAARGLVAGFPSGSQRYPLDCPHQASFAPASLPVRAATARQFATVLVPKMALNIGSLYLVGVDYQQSARVFEYRVGGTKRRARYWVSGVRPNSYGASTEDVCTGAARPR